MTYLDERWYVDPGYSYVKDGGYVWIFAGEKKVLAGGSTVGPTSVCQTLPSIATRIVTDHNAALAASQRPEQAGAEVERLTRERDNLWGVIQNAYDDLEWTDDRDERDHARRLVREDLKRALAALAQPAGGE